MEVSIDYEKEFEKELRRYGYKYNISQIFVDFCQCAACAINSPFENHRLREQQYLETLHKYRDENIGDFFSELFAILVESIAQKPFSDILGRTYMALGIASHKELGQCFTPGSIAELCGYLGVNRKKLDEDIRESGFASVNDCCVGGGCMMLGFAKAMQSLGYNPQKQLMIVCNDIDTLCVNMTFIQLALNGLPAIVYTGDTMSLRFTDEKRTPMWFASPYFIKFERFIRN